MRFAATAAMLGVAASAALNSVRMAAAPTLPSALRSGVRISTPPGVAAPAIPSDAFAAVRGGPLAADSAAKKDWAVGFCTHPEEEAYYVTDVEGEIPAELRGTLFRNGPGRLDRGDHSYAHIFDGDGMLCAFAFDDGRLHFRNRFVRTKEWAEEETANRLLHRNTFGTQPRGGWTANAFNMIQKNVANTHVVRWGGKLLALWEAAQPYALDPATLETRGIDTLGGTLRQGMPFTTGSEALDNALPGLSGDPLSAHGRIDTPDPASARDAARGERYVTYGYRAQPSADAVIAGRGAFDSELMIYEFDSAWKAAVRRPLRLTGFAFVHDFAVTENYYLWFQNPCDFDPAPFVLGEKNPAELITYDGSRPTKIHVVPRDPASGRQQRELEIDACFVFHHGRAYEEAGGELGAETIVIDSVVLEAFPDFGSLVRSPDDADKAELRATPFNEIPINRLKRFTLDLAEGDARAAVTQRTPRPRAVEFPCIGNVAPRKPHSLVYTACAASADSNNPFQGVSRTDMVTGEERAHFPGPRRFTNEPIFVARPGAEAEDDGWLLVLVNDGEAARTGLYVYDAREMEPVAIAWLNGVIPYGLHGTWADGEVFGEV